ncbi:multiubiquitin domain-containing protein [Bradyrhizobium sp. SZCCHNRI20481]|uniref:multiubiquitin domain-containing protein n=1 Tax=Bradyrhizobium sp. SZCCHNRI20481 TaxID=3057286 RepID=UPI002916AD4C|nr:multiubiquitin domain-containing protein [Bradyrhizobium sp. SZCCHNRI20481]
MSENLTENARNDEIRVHIDQTPYHSPSPTTGAALYALAHIHEGHELFREVTGDHEDEFVPNNGNEIRLKQDEHFHSAKDRKFKIIVNLEEKVVDKRVLTFRGVVKLAYPHVQDGPDVIYTVTFKKAVGPEREGTLDEGQSVEIKNGTIFNVRRTDRS